MTNQNTNPIFIIINDNNITDTPKYLEVLKKHMRQIKQEVKFTGNYKKPIIQIVQDDDEEARAIIPKKYEVLQDFIGTVENKRKINKRLNTPKEIKTFFQQHRNNLLKDEGEFGEFAVYLMDLLDAELYQKTKTTLFPIPGNITDEQYELKHKILKSLTHKILIEKKVPSTLNMEDVIKIVLKKNQNLAKDDEILIKTVKEILRLK